MPVKKLFDLTLVNRLNLTMFEITGTAFLYVQFNHIFSLSLSLRKVQECGFTFISCI